jgi:hypothetical protein
MTVEPPEKQPVTTDGSRSKAATQLVLRAKLDVHRAN